MSGCKLVLTRNWIGGMMFSSGNMNRSEKMAEMIAMQMHVPREWLPDLKDQAAFLAILGLGLEEYRMQRALSLYEQGLGTLG